MKKKNFIIFLTRRFFPFLFLFFFIPQGFSQDLISHLRVEGNKIVSEATVVSKIKTRKGIAFNENIINEDVKNLYSTGFFETVEVEKQESPQGVVITFKLKEKAVLKKLTIGGCRFIGKKRIEEAIEIKEGAFVDEYKLKEAVSKIKGLYAKKGFTQANVTYKVDVSQELNEAQVKFSIEEKKVLKVRRVSISGNKSISSRKINKLLKTRKAWLFNRGIFKDSVCSDDLERIKDFYQRQGFSDVSVDKNVSFEKKGVYVTITIDEGRRYYIGEITIEGNVDVPLGALNEAAQLGQGDVFSEQGIYEDSSKIREVYVERGYIFSQVKPLSVFNLETEKVDITYKIVENEVAYVERINIRGNIKTKDKIIRRELRIYPGDRFDGGKIKKSRQRLENLGFFEEIRFGTEPGSKTNWVNLDVETKETKTGYLSFGGGYSSIDEFMGFVEIRQRNFDYKNFSTFTGAGQDLSLMASIGTLTEHYQLSFTNPWIFDQPVSFGFDGYKKGHSREENVGYAYEQDIRGGAVRLGREFNDNLKAGIAYRLERVEISDVVSTAHQDLKDEAGINDLSSVEFNLSFDTRDNVFSPSKGISFLNTLGVTGGFFGGDKDFIKNFTHLSLFFPLINKSVIEGRLRAGFADPFSNTQKVPIYERFFAGGASTIRGYNERKVGPIDSVTEDPIGGEAMFVGNIEYTYPLADFLKLATFFDTGNVWKKNSNFLNGGLKSSVGLGLRVKTPIGPVSVDYGWPLDTEPGEEGKQGRFHFSISRGF
ncbi:MAG: outer membrane protein assembly factor BamA [Candidatus Omnitrophica bacterium]|nr:outer membrane protein assembly factor BamA [Candidatus Omnitrophota bacterium]